MHNNDEINEAIQHFKLTKKDQQLLVAGATLMTVATAGAMATTTNAHADTVKNNNVKTEQVNKVNNNVNNGWHANSVAQIKQAIQKQGGNVYTIQYGDTLSAIAQAMNINMATLQQINHIANANVIIAGNKIGFSADHQNVQVMNNQGKVIAQAPVHANAPITPVVNHAVATPVAHTATPASVVHTTTVNKPVTTTHTEYVPQQVTTTKEVPTQVTTNQTKTVTKNVPVTTTDANVNQTTTMKPETTTETVPVTTTVNKPVTVTDTTNQPTTTATTTPSQTPSSSVDNGSSSVANTTTPTTNNSNVDNSSSSNANTANSGQLVNGYTPQQSSSASANSSSNTSSSTDSSSNASSSSQASQSSSSSSSMSNGYQPQDNNINNSSSSTSVNEATRPQVNEYVNGQDDNNGLINYFTADAAWWDKQPNAHALDSNNSDDMNLFRQECLRDINLIREENGLGAVTEDDFIDKAAQYHANYEAQQEKAGHCYIGADGQPTGQDVSVDYIQKANKGNDYGNGTECGYSGNSNFTPQGLADRMFATIMSDPDHLYGILDETEANQVGTNKDDEYSHVGFGMTQGADGNYYGIVDGYDVPSDSNFSPLGNSPYTHNVTHKDGGTFSDNGAGTISITYD